MYLLSVKSNDFHLNGWAREGSWYTYSGSGMIGTTTTVQRFRRGSRSGCYASEENNDDTSLLQDEMRS